MNWAAWLIDGLAAELGGGETFSRWADTALSPAGFGLLIAALLYAAEHLLCMRFNWFKTCL